MGQLRIKVAELKSVNTLKAPEASKLSAAILSLKREIQKSGNATQTYLFYIIKKDELSFLLVFLISNKKSRSMNLNSRNLAISNYSTRYGKAFKQYKQK